MRFEEALPAVKAPKFANVKVNRPPRPPREMSPPPEIVSEPLEIDMAEPALLDSVIRFEIIWEFPPKPMEALPWLVKVSGPAERLLPTPRKTFVLAVGPVAESVVPPEWVLDPFSVKFPFENVRFPDPVIVPSITIAEEAALKF